MPSQTRRVSVLFILSSLCFGGAEIQTITLAKHLRRDRFRVGLVHLKNGNNNVPELNAEKLELLWCGDFSKGWTVSGLMRLQQCLKSFQPDVIVCVNSYPLLYGYLANWLAKSDARIVEVFHTTQHRDTKSRCMQKFYSYFFNRCDRIVYVCKNQQNYWEERGLRAELGMYIYNGIDTLHFADTYSVEEKTELRARYRYISSDFVVGICAVLRPEKNHIELLKAIKMLKNDGMSVKLLIIGDGPQRENIESFTYEYELTNDVAITGFQTDVRLYLAACDMFAITSSSVETFSLAILEAMSMSKPVVASNIGGASEQIEHGYNGYIYELGDIGLLSKALIELSNIEKSKEMGAVGRIKAQEFYSQKIMLQAYEKMLIDVVEDNKC